MAINKITAPLSTSPAVFAAPVVNQLLALSIASEKHARIVNGYILKGAMFCILGDIFVADSDTTISGTESGSIAVRFTVSGNAAIAEYVSSNDATWNGAYFGFYDSSDRMYIYDYLYAGDFINYLYPVITTESISLTTTYSNPNGITTRRIQKSGKYRVYFVFQTSHSGTYSIVLFKNGVAVGTEKTIVATGQSWYGESQTEDFLFYEGDYVELRVKRGSPTDGVIRIEGYSFRNQAGAW